MGLINYNITVTGDCTNSNLGQLVVTPISGTAPYTIDWYNPNLGVDTTVLTESSRASLSAGTYQLLITDSSLPNNSSYVNLVVSSGVCLVSDSINTTCGLNNGQITITATTPSNFCTYYLYSLNNGFISSATTVGSYQIFNNLSADTYYCEVYDEGGCSGCTATCIIKDSTFFDFGFFVINNSNCTLTPTGKIYVTGQTGNGPYTYLWSPGGQTTSSISGLTAGNYQVTVSNSEGCSITKQTSLSNANPLSIINFINTSPSCFQNNGQFIVNIQGGTPPYYYQLSNGQNDISFNTTMVYTGLSSGLYTLTVTDVGLCTTSGSTTLSTPNSFTVISINGTNSLCNNSSGSINIQVGGGSSPYTYSLTDSTGGTQTFTTSQVFYNFNNLSSGPYVVTISDNSTCVYQTQININNINKFNVTTTKVDTTCGLNNGSVTISVDTPGTYNYFLDSSHLVNGSNSQTQVFTNLPSGLYNGYVQDNTGCKQPFTILIGQSSNIGLSLIKTNCINGSDGAMTALITGGLPPYIINWSSNVGAQTGIYVTGLTAGTYSVTVTDSNECTTTKSETISCIQNYTSTKLYNICEDTFTTSALAKTGISEMYFQGYQELIINETDCLLQTAQFTLSLTVSGVTYESVFYNSTSLLDYPTDEEYANELKTLLANINGLGSIIIDPTNNILQIFTDCFKELANKNVTIDLKIDYYICCRCAIEAEITGQLITPTPTNTPTQTPTSTPTPTPTPTNTPTNTPTPTPTNTPTPTPTVGPSFLVTNNSTSCTIVDVIQPAATFVWPGGPVPAGGFETGTHGAFTDTIEVNVTCDFGRIVLKKNGVQIDCKDVVGSSPPNYIINASLVPFSNSDTLEIILENGSC